jgi:predicted acylesterase/phospholipase RssA
MSDKTVLSIDGGGTCGLFSHHMLQKLVPLERFNIDLIVGVSAGAILGAAFSSGLLPTLDDATVHMFTSNVFGDATTTRPWFEPKYKGETKSSVLQSLFGDLKFGDLVIPMAIIVDRIHNTPKLCRSWDPEYQDLSLVQLLDATSAVPVLFPPITILGEQYFDGGVVNSTPISLAHLTALEFFPGATISLLSLGTEQRIKQDTAAARRYANHDMGLVQLLALGVPMKVLTQASSLANEVSMRILSPRFLRIEGHVSAQIDDLSVQTRCKTVADTVWERMENSIRRFLETSDGPDPATEATTATEEFL